MLYPDPRYSGYLILSYLLMKSKKPLQILIHNRGYEGSKPSPQDRVYMLEEDPSFAEYFEIVFNNYDIP